MPRSTLASLTAALLLTVGCGGSDDDGGPGPGPRPAPVATVEVSPPVLDLDVGEMAQLTVTLRDAQGNVLTGRVIQFDSDDPLIASVSSSGVVTGQGDGNTFVRARSEGQEGSSAVNVVLPEFNPDEDTELDGGDQEFANVEIPEGVTVTAKTDVNIIVSGIVDIAGTLTSDCNKLGIKGGGNVTISGTIQNNCQSNPQDAGDSLKIESNGNLTISGGKIASSGALGIINGLAGLFGSEGMLASSGNVVGPCVLEDVVIEHSTAAPPGTGGLPLEVLCDGDLTLDGVEVNGQSGGDGASMSGGTTASGQNGGHGGLVRVETTGNAAFVNGTVLRIPAGGKGGSATAEPTAAGASATAMAGDGGDSGLLQVNVGGTTSVESGGLMIEVGGGGDGGNATAVGMDGDPAQDGGAATAVAGDGGMTLDADVEFLGGASGVENAEVIGGNAGAGGTADATGGDGGDGTEANKDAGTGGAMTSTAGDGGDALAGNLVGSPIGIGGNAGSAFFADGRGGTGFDGCAVEPQVEGGSGGDGGAAAGRDGVPGTGLSSGAGGRVVVAPGTADGGDAGSGTAPGATGGNGPDQISVNTSRDNLGPAFRDGAPGGVCGQEEVFLDFQDVTSDTDFGLSYDVTYAVFSTESPNRIFVFDFNADGNFVLCALGFDDIRGSNSCRHDLSIFFPGGATDLTIRIHGDDGEDALREPLEGGVGAEVTIFFRDGSMKTVDLIVDGDFDTPDPLDLSGETKVIEEIRIHHFDFAGLGYDEIHFFTTPPSGPDGTDEAVVPGRPAQVDRPLGGR